MTALGEPDTWRTVVTTGEELADLLADQHAELREAWCRVPLLHDSAREDVFLHARRRLAVHVALEQVVLEPRLDPSEAREREQALVRDVAAAEHEGLESIDFDAACARVAVAFLRHSAAGERLVLTGVLSEREREAVRTAIALWEGGGDAYLGNTWAEMRATALDQLSAPD